MKFSSLTSDPCKAVINFLNHILLVSREHIVEKSKFVLMKSVGYLIPEDRVKILNNRVYKARNDSFAGD